MASHPPRRGPARAGRLRSRLAFRETIQEGSRWTLERLVISVRPTGGDVRVGFVCGRQVGGAVARNRVRRVLKEAWRMVAPRAGGGFDVVFVARPAALGAKRNDLVGDMVEALGRAGVIAS